eukprot:scaffold2089_cov336-Prasinococcus_capsulatus_cf.AAC.2
MLNRIDWEAVRTCRASCQAAASGPPAQSCAVAAAPGVQRFWPGLPLAGSGGGTRGGPGGPGGRKLVPLCLGGSAGEALVQTLLGRAATERRRWQSLPEGLWGSPLLRCRSELPALLARHQPRSTCR